VTPRQGLAFVKRHGVVLQSARGPAPSLAEAVAGAPIRGSWWGHPAGQEIFAVLSAVCDSPEVLYCRLLGGKVTLVHRRLWPALVRLASRFDPAHLAAIREEHTASGRHQAHSVPYPEWVPAEVHAEARALTEEAAERALGPIAAGASAPRPTPRRRTSPPTPPARGGSGRPARARRAAAPKARAAPASPGRRGPRRSG
jgi:hypothetical protein